MHRWRLLSWWIVKVLLHSLLFRLTISLCFLFAFTTVACGVEPLPKHLVNFASQPGLILLKENLNPNLLKLLAHFTTQKTVTYCGIASAVMLLNSTDIVPPVDSQHIPPIFYYFTQDNFFNEQVKKIITPEEVRKSGISLAKLSKAIQSYGLKARPFFANEINLEEFRTLLKNAIVNQQFVIVNFLRTELQQKGGGHHSPIAAYDRKTDRFLLLDVARYKYPACWVKTEDLWRATNTMAGSVYRGVIIIY